MSTWLAATGAFLATIALTGLVRRYALHRGMLDVPNARSSHTVPTPRGGGVAIVAVALFAAIRASQSPPHAYFRFNRSRKPQRTIE